MPNYREFTIERPITEIGKKENCLRCDECIPTGKANKEKNDNHEKIVLMYRGKVIHTEEELNSLIEIDGRDRLFGYPSDISESLAREMVKKAHPEKQNN